MDNDHPARPKHSAKNPDEVQLEPHLPASSPEHAFFHLSSRPGFREIAVPEAYRSHPLIHERLFFTLPGPLLNAIVRKIGEERFDAELLQMEYALSDICGDHTQFVGFWGCQLIGYPLLRLPSSVLPRGQLLEAAAAWGMTPEHIENAFKLGQATLDWNATVSRGYLGWLSTSPTFLREHLELFTTWETQIAKSGVLQLGPLVPEGTMPPGTQCLTDKSAQKFGKAFEDFYVRWRLNGLAAPYLPVPLTPKLSRSFPLTVLEQLRQAGGLFFVPDTFPVPSRDQFRRLLEDSLRSGQMPEHLADWTRIVQSSNAAKREIVRFSRLFELQHYWRAIWQRHSQALDRTEGKLKEALASFLAVDAQVIHRDLLAIRKRLGADWTHAR